QTRDTLRVWPEIALFSFVFVLVPNTQEPQLRIKTRRKKSKRVRNRTDYARHASRCQVFSEILTSSRRTAEFVRTNRTKMQAAIEGHSAELSVIVAASPMPNLFRHAPVIQTCNASTHVSSRHRPLESGRAYHQLHHRKRCLRPAFGDCRDVGECQSVR